MSTKAATFNIILYQPEIPANTGNIGRTCVATQSHLHLIGPLGFDIDEKSVRRAGLDYWKYLQVTYYPDYQDFLTRFPQDRRIFYFSTKGENIYYNQEFRQGDGLMFGPETRGLPANLWEGRAAQCLQIPMLGPTRSLNLSNAVAVVMFEGVRQLNLS